MDLFKVVHKRLAPGILILNHRQEAIFCNPTAMSILHELNEQPGFSNKPTKLPSSDDIETLYDTLKESVYNATKKESDKQPSTRITLFSTPKNAYFCRELVINEQSRPIRNKNHTMMLIEKVSPNRMIDLEAFGTQFQLTKRKIEIVELLSLGLVNKEIAEKLCVSEDTIKAHIRHIMRRLGVNTRTGIVSVLLQR